MRLHNGVKARMDGRGDPWANAHRDGLDNRCYMNDVDALFGMEVWGANTGERMFLEYEPDDYGNRTSAIRRFAYVALYDRKTTLKEAYSDRNRVSMAVYLDMARKLSCDQPNPMRFFFVVGGESPPWQMVEHDIETGGECGERVLIHGARDFRLVWNRIGLEQLRESLRDWVMAA